MEWVIFARSVCVDVVEPLDVTKITDHIVAAEFPIDGDSDHATHFGLITAEKIDTHCRVNSVKRLVRRINSLIKARLPYNFTQSLL